jgi:hypothetical protein
MLLALLEVPLLREAVGNRATQPGEPAASTSSANGATHGGGRCHEQ